MKHLLLLFVSLAIARVYAQDALIPDGVYLNVEQLQNHTPSFNIDLDVVKMERKGTALRTYNEYELRSFVDSITRSYIKHRIYAYVKEGSVYINCDNLDLSHGFSICETQGTYLAFCVAEHNKGSGEQFAVNTLSSGMINALRGPMPGQYTTPSERSVYVLSMKTGNVKLLNKDYLNKRFEKYPDLMEKYSSEKIPERERVLIRCIEMLNDKVKGSSE